MGDFSAVGGLLLRGGDRLCDNMWNQNVSGSEYAPGAVAGVPISAAWACFLPDSACNNKQKW